MTDGISIRHIIPNFEEWKRKTGISFSTNVDMDSGEVETRTRGEKIVATFKKKWETFDLTVTQILNIPNGKTIHYLTIRGSLHKNQFGGKNYESFTWALMQEQIRHICKCLFINPQHAKINTIEVGVNLRTPFAVTPFLETQVIAHKGKRFNWWDADKNGFRLGITCKNTKYTVKMYDKGLQNSLDYPLMRFELKFPHMEKLKEYGILYLADLQNQQKVNALQELLLKAWQEILFYDTSIDLENESIKPKDRVLLMNGRNPMFWSEHKKRVAGRTYYDHIDKFKSLVSAFGNIREFSGLDLIRDAWDNLFDFHTFGTDQNGVGKTKIRTIGTSGERDCEIANPHNRNIKVIVPIVRDRFCASCGNDISSQKKGSKFCSAKYVGEVAAKQCRNSDSNPRNAYEKEIAKLKITGSFESFKSLIKPYVRPNKQIPIRSATIFD